MKLSKHSPKLILTLVASGLLSYLGGCASSGTKDGALATFVGAQLEDGGAGRKKLVLKFTPETPQYEVVHNKQNTMSEVRWKSTVKEPYRQELTFSEAGRGVRKALILVDPKANQGTLTLWHDNSDAFSFSRQNPQEFVLLPDDPFRQVSSKDDLKFKKINLNVKQAGLDKVLRTLAAESGKSLILGSAVKGDVTVNLQNLTYEQAIDMLLRPTAYRAEHAGDVTIIRSAKEDKTFRSFRMRYVDVTMVAPIIREIASKDAAIAIDNNSNTFFIIDRFEALKNLEVLIAQLDQEPRQVEVEAAILEVQLTNTLDYGIDFSGVAHYGTSPGGMVSNDIRTGHLASIDGSSLAAKGFFAGVTWQSFRGVLSALASKGKLNLLARPRVVTLTDHEANIVLGSKLGYSTTTFSNTGQAIQDIKFLTVGTQLKIKPHITQNNDIIMFIKPEVSDGAVDPKTGIPSENTTSSETKIFARNGQTIVMGGLLRDRVERSSDKIPLLGDLPVFGAIFGGTSSQNTKNEVVILLSPKIITNELLARFDKQGGSLIGRFYDENGVEMPNRIGDIPNKE